MTKSVRRLGVTGLVVGLLMAGALSVSAQGLLNARQNVTTDTVLDFKGICFRSLLGINDEVLADTNRFSYAKDWIPAIELGERFGDFTNATVMVRKDRNTGKLALSDVKFIKALGPKADEKVLLKEYEHAVDLVCKLLGVNVTCPGLVDPATYLRRRFLLPMDRRIKSRICLNLAKGQRVEIEATEASYIIRAGQPMQTGAPTVEIKFAYNGSFGVRRSGGQDSESVKELTLGTDCSDLLSDRMKALPEQQRQQIQLIQEELKRVREAKAVAAREEGGKVGASCSTSNQLASLVRKEDFKAKLTGVAIIEGGRMCGFESRALKAEFQSPEHSIEVPFGKAACFRVEYDFPDGYQARVWTHDRWQKGQDGSSYYFGSNPSPLYKGKGIAFGFLDMLERGKTCTLKRLAIGTNSEPKLEGLSKGWDIVVTPVDIKFHGPETAQKAPSKENEKVVLNNQSQGTNAVADKLQSCDFLLNNDFKKNAKFYLCLFSASWCGPCRAEMPRIAKTYAETLKDDPDIELIHFSRDQNDEKAMAWAKEHDVKFPVVKPKGGNPLDLHCNGIPHLFIIKANGVLQEEGHPMRLFTEEKLRELKK